MAPLVHLKSLDKFMTVMNVKSIAVALLCFSFVACENENLPLSLEKAHSSSKPTLATVSTVSRNTSQKPTQLLNAKDVRIADSLGINKNRLAELLNKKIYEFSQSDVNLYLPYVQAAYPDLTDRVNHLAQKNIDQEYDLYLLGEYPFESTDTQPTFDLQKSDCVVFVEHIYAMALSNNWKEFYTMLQRIRYKDGEIGYITRNHFTEADWDISNAWLVSDITNKLGDGRTRAVSTRINRKAFFKKRDLDVKVENETIRWDYVPVKQVEGILSQLKTGDFVNVVRGYSSGGEYVGHVGLISVDENDGTVYFVHSTEPRVKKQPLLSYIDEQLNRPGQSGWVDRWGNFVREGRKPKLYGFKFLRLNEDARDRLKDIDGPKAPKLTIFGNTEDGYSAP